MKIVNMQGKVIYENTNIDNMKDLTEEEARVGANLTEDCLIGADLEGADLRGANLRAADLRVANLIGVDLEGADLRGANLRVADLRGANLAGANLIGADLEGADLRGANLEGARLPDFSIVPEKGSFIAYKKVSGGIILELQIPASAKRTSSLVGRKCRTDKVKVLKAYTSEGVALRGGWYRGVHNGEFIYEVGKIIKEPDYDSDIRVECTEGIHFFITLKEAKEY